VDSQTPLVIVQIQEKKQLKRNSHNIQGASSLISFRIAKILKSESVTQNLSF